MGLSECWPAKCFLPAWYLEQVACTDLASHCRGRTASKLSGDSQLEWYLCYHYCLYFHQIECYLLFSQCRGRNKKANKNAKCDVNMFSAGQKNNIARLKPHVLSGKFISPNEVVTLSLWQSGEFRGLRIQPDCLLYNIPSQSTSLPPPRSHEPSKLLAKLLLWQCKCWLGSSVKNSQPAITSD